MNKRDLLLAALAAGEGDEHTPVQIQKLLFIAEKEISGDLGGAPFEFVPYDYGPFDATVYEVLHSLEVDGLASSSITRQGWKKYKLTGDGQAQGEHVLEGLSPKATQYMRKLSHWVRTRTFSQLVSSVYKAYPEMKINSVFKG